MTFHNYTFPSELLQLVLKSAELRKQFAQTSASVDKRGEDPAENLELIWRSGLNALSVPQAYGGLSNGLVGFAFEALTETIINIAAGEGSTGQIYFVQALLARQLFSPYIDLPETTRQQLAHEILHENVRLVSSNAEAGSQAPAISHPVAGGIVLRGTKTFNTASGGARYAVVGHRLEGAEGFHIALVRLDDPSVHLHNDWDNMGQRATVSQTITYDDVFVPDGWHAPLSSHVQALLGVMGFVMHGALLLGIGLGGFDAALNYVQTKQRVVSSGAKLTSEDPLLRLRVGDLSIVLAAAQALLREAARAVEAFADGDDVSALLIHASRAKVASIEAALKVTNDLFEIIGARGTASSYRFDRYWRDARTFSVALPTDLRRLAVGEYELNGQALAMNFAQAFQGRI
ncbi:desulfurization protein [Ktedonosporobacter rubrisoli]|uniref:Desulfurization protein n=1 Tax=Ktedonosporobacter rubrisoli TaxID=2509675 RepID=A0A4P6JIL8_KTERU|nr:acyl-CoA dehydrogenase family protein [Ktedonosporobacter rubrisoli]QBD74833.1 desulfurization protein [Ktedonosporobacter rubrisoli]